MFNISLLLSAAVIIICVLANKLSNKIGMPVLIAFIALGMVFGSDGILKIPFENYSFAEQICSVALVFIMFYGGFGTKLSEAKPVAVKALLLSSVGVIFTAALTTVFCFFVLKIKLLESMLIGAVMSSTDAASVLGVAVLAYALPTLVGGNGYLSAYIVGIVLGNQNIHNKKSLVHFFDGMTGLMQMLIFFLLGLLSFPSKILTVLLPSIFIALFITFVARPLAVATVLAPFKTKISQYLVVSWAGLRGAASIVFAIMAMVGGVTMEQDVFHIAFCVVLFSITLQGSLLPFVASKTNMIDKTGSVLKTFNDYSDETEINFIRLNIDSGNRWIDRAVKDISLPPQMLFAAIYRNDETIIPNGETVIYEGDTIILGAPSHGINGDVRFREISANDRKNWRGKSMAEIEFPDGYLVIMIKRGDDVVIPVGSTIIEKNDELVLVSK